MAMLQKAKNALKRFYPPPVDVFNREIHKLNDAIVAVNEKISAKVTELSNSAAQQQQNLAKDQKQITETLAVLQHGVDQRKDEIIAQLLSRIDRQEQEVTQKVQNQNLHLKEVLTAELQKQTERQNQALTAELRQQIEQGKQSILAEVNQHDEQRYQGIITALKEQVQSRRGELTAELQNQLKQQSQALAAEIQKLMQSGEKLCSELQKQTSLYEAKLSQQKTLIDQVNRQCVISSRNASEAVWAEIFNNAVAGSGWLIDTAFSPGRWAVGYPYLYVMYRVLNEVYPRNILELGLGQSTRMLAQYVAHALRAVAQYAPQCKIRHQIVEHDLEWCEFFARSFKLPPCSNIVTLNREFVPYKEAEAVRVFKDFSKTFAGQRFDFISIDAPLGSQGYSRIDVLQLLPDCLAEDFVIMLDDCERSGENHTWEEMKRVLDTSGIKYAEGVYSGKKDCRVMSSKSLKFVCSIV